jgi:type IV pilus assembly protein PilA
MMAMQTLPARNRPRGHRFTEVEVGVALALAGSVLAVAVPTFAKNVHSSRFVEPVSGLERMSAAAVEYARSRPVVQAFPPSAALTPSVPPRGRCEVDPPGLWESPTWRALDFRPSALDEPHCFAFGFESSLSPAKSTFRAHAHGDLDGDGITSTFEMTGHVESGDPRGPTVDPGMFVQSEVD